MARLPQASIAKTGGVQKLHDVLGRNNLLAFALLTRTDQRHLHRLM